VLAVVTKDSDLGIQLSVEDQESLLAVVDLDRILEIYVLGKNKKIMRVAAAQFVKGLYLSGVKAKTAVFNKCLDLLKTLKTSGINSSSFLTLFAFIFKTYELSNDEMKLICNYFYNVIDECNTELTAHPNLDMYSVLQTLCSSAPSSHPSMSSSPYGFPQAF